VSNHTIYTAIVRAVELGDLLEPFTTDDFRTACPNFAASTYSTFLAKHCDKNLGGNSVLFCRVARGSYQLTRPFLYGL
jgi:hypothetical protein